MAWERIEGYSPPKPPCGLTILKGYNGVALQRKFVKFLIGNFFARDYFNWVVNTQNPDEHFYSTLGSVEWSNVPRVGYTLTQRFDMQMENATCYRRYLFKRAKAKKKKASCTLEVQLYNSSPNTFVQIC